ncbi:GTP pyrophosphokinase [Paenibacillus monticola]|uniref:RelA/SpoT domain-containing protein n=1 Tax=Paenibacillus monticola TaxID=2666075 RepID=A0A7X2H7I4_9BACL|nr:hypothetical protein [Paenibacillus monticola]MRN54885.1 hypothetical protein [Paenibacillus monticola]
MLASTQQEFEIKRPLYESLCEEALFIIKGSLTRESIKVNKIESRIKEYDSFAEKIERKEILSPFEEINDILGLRIVCLFLSDIPKIHKIINSAFTILEEDNKIDGSNVESFGYMSLHIIVKMKDNLSGPRYDYIKELRFEIQVRTMAMDSWANISHYLDYKSENDIPSDLKRDFHALSGLFYVADKHFEMFFKSKKENTALIIKKLEHTLSNTEEEINIDSLKAYMKFKFPNRLHKMGASSISDVINQLYNSRYRYINQIDEKIDQASEAFLQYEKDHPPGSENSKKKQQYADLGVIRISLDIIDENFRKLSSYDTETREYENYQKYIKTL